MREAVELDCDHEEADTRVRNENWPKANLHVTKENKSFKKKLKQKKTEDVQ